MDLSQRRPKRPRPGCPPLIDGEVSITVMARLPSSLLDRIESVRGAESRSSFIRMMIIDFLDRHELTLLNNCR